MDHRKVDAAYALAKLIRNGAFLYFWGKPAARAFP